jgi:hypothetical protein
MNKPILEHLYKIYKVDANWDGSKVNMSASGGFLSSFEPNLYKLDCNQTASFYFNNMHREKSGAVQVEVYSREFEHYSCPSSSSSSSSWGGSKNNKQYNGGFLAGETYVLKDRYIFSVELTEETLKFIDVGIFSSSEITSPLKVQEISKIFKKGLQEYGMPEAKSGGRKKSAKQNRIKRRRISKLRK